MSSDPCSKCNFTEVVLKHIHWVLETDFKNKKFLCSVTLEATTLQDGCSKLVGLLLIFVYSLRTLY